MNKNMTTLGEKIKTARKAANLNQKELADRLNKTHRTIQKYESGEITPPIDVINSIAKELNISPKDLIEDQRPSIELNAISDILTVLYNLNKKAGIRFEINVKRPPHYSEWSCSLKFDGLNKDAENNADICLLLEEFKHERLMVETYMYEPDNFNGWLERKLSYYSKIKLVDRELEVLPTEERIRRRNELAEKMFEQMQKNSDDNGDLE